MKEAISDAQNKKFSEFRKKVKQSLEDKLANHKEIVKNKEERETYAKVKDKFEDISKELEPETSE